MKKTTLSKKGFTLTEIVIVVAIIVIISAAAFVGVAVTLKRANDSRTLLNEQKGDNFELAARESIRDLTGNAADYVEAEYYEPDDDDEPVSGGGGEGGEGEGEGEGEGGEGEGGSGGGGGGGADIGGGSGGGGGSTVTNTPTPTPVPNTPTPTPAATSGGRVGSGTGTTAVPGSSCGAGGNAWNCQFSIGANAKEFTFYVPFDGITQLYCNTGNCTVSGSGHYYTVTMTYGSANSSSFGLGGSGVNGDLDMTQVKIVSYVPAD